MSQQPSMNVPGPTAPFVNLRVVPEVIERYETMTQAEIKYKHTITRVYRFVFLVFTILLLGGSWLLAFSEENVASVIAIGVALTTFRWFVMSYLDDRFE